MIDLKTIIKQHPSCLSSRSAFRSVLLDKYPGEKRMVNTLTAIYECGIADQIKGKSQIDWNELHGYITQLELDYGIPQKYSTPALEIWTMAYGVKCGSGGVPLERMEPPRRTRAIYFLVDSGFHMHGNKIACLNSAMETLIAVDLISYQNELDSFDLKIQIIKYGSGAYKIFDKPKQINEVCWNDLIATGDCDFGAAISLLQKELIADYQDCSPFLVAVSGNKCTDDYENQIMQISEIPMYAHATRVGIKVGEKADTNALLEFTRNRELIFGANDINLAKLIYNDTGYDP